jgi:hypothetical protein
LALHGLGDDESKEASWAARFTTGISTYFYGSGYSTEQFKEELDRIVKHIVESAQK